jgi:hypothetical protein
MPAAMAVFWLIVATLTAGESDREPDVDKMVKSSKRHQ